MLLRLLFASVLLIVYGPSAGAEVPCGIGRVAEAVAPVYPPIARAAHVSGTVLMLATFDTAGKVMEVRSVSGPMMLRAPAETFVKGWQANPYTGPRSCPVVVEFALAGEPFCIDENVKRHYLEPSRRLDVQHYRVRGYGPALCDPVADIVTRRKRFGIF